METKDVGQCPFCGLLILYTDSVRMGFSLGGEPCVFVHCYRCGARGPSIAVDEGGKIPGQHSTDLAISRWNEPTRHD